MLRKVSETVFIGVQAAAPCSGALAFSLERCLLKTNGGLVKKEKRNVCAPNTSFETVGFGATEHIIHTVVLPVYGHFRQRMNNYPRVE